MYILIKEQRATSPERFMINFKMSLFLIKMNLTVICKFFIFKITNYFNLDFLMIISNLLFEISNPNYKSFFNYVIYLTGIIILLSHQIYIALYYNDINYIHKQFFQRFDYQYFLEKKPHLNIL